jgi:Phosphotransacetylase
MNIINPIFIGEENKIKEEAKNISWDISSYEFINTNGDQEAAIAGANLAKENKIKVLIKGNIHTDILMRTYLKKEFGLISGKRLSHIWHMTTNENSKPLFITDGALNVAPRIDVKMHILKNVIEFANKINIQKPRVAILSGTEDAIESMPSSIEAKEIMERAQKENVNAYVHGPLAFDNAVSSKAAEIKKISNEVVGKADILLVPNLETGNALSKMMVYFMGACAAGIVVGGKVPVVVTSRADNAASRLASIAASIISSQ